MKSILTFICLLASIWASPTPIQNATASKTRIIGGDDAQVGQFPWQAALFIDDAYYCGGTLITQEWILTSAVCIYNHNSFLVLLGVTDLNDAIVGYSVSKAIVHEDYDGVSIRNDVGLLKLSEPIAFTDKINSIILAGDSLNTNVEIIVSGFGKLRDDTNIFSDKLQWITLITMNNDECYDIFNGGIEDTYACAYADYGTKGICGGDMGGPAIKYAGSRPVLVAISTARSNNGCEAGFPSIFTRVKPYLEWIAVKIASE